MNEHIIWKKRVLILILLVVSLVCLFGDGLTYQVVNNTYQSYASNVESFPPWLFNGSYFGYKLLYIKGSMHTSSDIYYSINSINFHKHSFSYFLMYSIDSTPIQNSKVKVITTTLNASSFLPALTGTQLEKLKSGLVPQSVLFTGAVLSNYNTANVTVRVNSKPFHLLYLNASYYSVKPFPDLEIFGSPALTGNGLFYMNTTYVFDEKTGILTNSVSSFSHNGTFLGSELMSLSSTNSLPSNSSYYIYSVLSLPLIIVGITSYVSFRSVRRDQYR